MDLEQVAMEVAAGKELDNMEALDAEVSNYFKQLSNISHKHLNGNITQNIFKVFQYLTKRFHEIIMHQ